MVHPRSAVQALALILMAAPALAEPPALGLPLDCVPGQTCWVMNYPDTEPGPAAKDFACRARSYDGHDGTDMALRDVAAMTRGVAVRAAAAGTVLQTRDGEEDGLWMAGRSQEVLAARKECGNRVAISHGDGWVTDYCHLRKGSVAVKPGDRVAAGQNIALVGLSGMTAFPHAHMGLLRLPPGQPRGIPVDPFTGTELAKGTELSAGCGRQGRSLWAAPMAYEPAALYAAGFASTIPGAEAIKANAASPAQLSREVPALVLWGALFGVTAGDRIQVRLMGADGTDLVNQTTIIDRDQAWRMVAMGKPRPADAWPVGTYGGSVVLERAGMAPQTRTLTVELR
ncbi:MAG: M23 family metallopeptidase [Rhodospirillaceae bacterium]|nr:M23 family metallopeptidase [Rhodospirillales bacterium]